MGRYADAERELRRELATNPGSARAHALLSCTLHNLKRYQEAYDEATLAVQLQPDLGFAHYALSFALAVKREYLQAQNAVEEGLKYEPHAAWLYARYAEVLGYRAEWQMSLAAAEQGLNLDPGRTNCYRLRAEALKQLGRKQESRKTLEQGLSVHPEDARMHYSLGCCLLEEGDCAGAIKHLGETLRIDPTMKDARDQLLAAFRTRHPVYRLALAGRMRLSRILSRMGSAAAVLFVVLCRCLLMPPPNDHFSPSATERLGMGWDLFGHHIGLWHPSIFALLYLLLIVNCCLDPLFDLVLQTDPFTRLMLNRREILLSRFVGAAVGVAVLGTAGAVLYHAMAFYGLAIGVGLAAMTARVCRRPVYIRDGSWVVAIFLSVVALLDIVLLFIQGQALTAVLSLLLCTALAVCGGYVMRQLTPLIPLPRAQRVPPNHDGQSTRVMR
jgi:tetratricopeptide (TPR) repeat protein